MNDLLCGIRMRAQVSFVLSQSTRCDRRTDGHNMRMHSQSNGKNETNAMKSTEQSN